MNDDVSVEFRILALNDDVSVEFRILALNEILASVVVRVPFVLLFFGDVLVGEDAHEELDRLPESHLVGENAAANVARRRESNRRRLARVPVDVQRTFRIVRGKRAPQRVRRERARPAPNVERIFLRIAAFGRGGGAASLAAHHPPDRAALIGPRRGNEFGEIALERWRIAGRSSGVVHVAKRGVSRGGTGTMHLAGRRRARGDGDDRAIVPVVVPIFVFVPEDPVPIPKGPRLDSRGDAFASGGRRREPRERRAKPGVRATPGDLLGVGRGIDGRRGGHADAERAGRIRGSDDGERAVANERDERDGGVLGRGTLGAPRETVGVWVSVGCARVVRSVAKKAPSDAVAGARALEKDVRGVFEGRDGHRVVVARRDARDGRDHERVPAPGDQARDRGGRRRRPRETASFRGGVIPGRRAADAPRVLRGDRARDVIPTRGRLLTRHRPRRARPLAAEREPSEPRSATFVREGCNEHQSGCRLFRAAETTNSSSGRERRRRVTRACRRAPACV